jgi:hypothetical protein
VAADLPESTLDMIPLGRHSIRGSEHPLVIFGASETSLLRYEAPEGYSEVVLSPLPVAAEPA